MDTDQKSQKKDWQNVVVVALFLFVALMFFPFQSSARHRCPKVPTGEGIFGLFMTTTALPTGTTMASARSSNTSGCDRGHPSKGFYRPRKSRISYYLRDTLEVIAEESSQGKGKHLEALASLAGCPSDSYQVFSQTMQHSYNHLFPAAISDHPSDDQVYQISDGIITILETQPRLSKSCGNG